MAIFFSFTEEGGIHERWEATVVNRYCEGEEQCPFDAEWDNEWEAAVTLTTADDKRPWWEEPVGEDDPDVGAFEDETVPPEMELPCELEEVLEGRDKYFVEHLRRVEALVKGVATKGENHFEAIQGKQGRLKIFKSLHGQELIKLVKKGCDPRCHELSVVDQNPFVGIYHKVVKKWKGELNELIRYGVIKGGVIQTVAILNSIVDDLRLEVSRPIVKDYERRVDRSAKARAKKACAIIDKCFEHRSRLLVLRVDLGYRKGRFIDSPDFSRDLLEVKQRWAVLSDGLKRGLVVPNVMEVFGKIEYGVLAGFHIHLIVIMKGAEHQEDITYARLIGQYWCQEVVGEEGRYFNCNRIKHRYQQLGIGEINYYEKEKIAVLKEIVVGYVVKSDYYLSALFPAKKTFVQVSCAKPNLAGKRGRPRRYLSQ